jgi:hypothetical protein
MSSYWDILAVLAIAGLMLLVLDWRIGRAFGRHELVEQKANALLAMTAETGAATALEATRHLRELRADIEGVKGKLSGLAVDVAIHDRRLGAVEERYMRAALLYPKPSEEKP